MKNKFANNFNDLLRIRNITQTQIAKELQVRPNTVNQWAKGKREPELDMILSICDILETTPTEILGYKNKEERSTKEYMTQEAIEMLLNS